jgi:tRNA nucleotidyltransferase/poly(A) polymerase
MFKKFSDYKRSKDQLNEASETNGKKSENDLGLGAKITLGDNNDYLPFEVSDDPKSESYGKNKNLAPIIRAFKDGANWGWSRDDKNGNDKPVKIGSKKLYLAGGAVRSHLKGEKPRNIELVTNASPDEVYHILKQNDFNYLKDEEPKAAKGKNFWITKTNKNGRPFAFGVQVNEDEFELEVFRKTPRGIEHDSDDPEPGTHKDDASGRDFTINSMYILLSNDNGPNKELVDFHSGIHDLKNKKVTPIGGMKALDEHPSRVIRMIRFMHADGDPKKLTDDEKESIKNASKNLKKVDKKYMMKEFRKGFKGDTRKYLSLASDLGITDSLFPGKFFDSKLPKELSEIEDADMPLAYALRLNNPDHLRGLDLDNLNKILVLIKLLNLKSLDQNNLDDLTNCYNQSDISTRKLQDWALKIGNVDPKLVQGFIAHCRSPRVKVSFSDQGKDKVHDDFADLIDPFNGELDDERAKSRRKEIEYRNFLSKL